MRSLMYIRSETEAPGEERALESRESASKIDCRSRALGITGMWESSVEEGIRVNGRYGLSPVLAAEQRSNLSNG